MKKASAFLLSLIMILSLPACTEDRAKDKPERVSTAASTEAPSVEPSSTAPVTEPTSSDMPEHIDFGYSTSTFYENELFGLGVRVPDDWDTYTYAELAELNETDENTLVNNFYFLVNSGPLLYTFDSVDESTGNEIYVSIESLDYYGNAGMNSTQFLEDLEQLYLEDEDLSEQESEIGTMYVDDSSYDYLLISYKTGDEYNCLLHIAIVTEDYAETITFDIYDVDALGYVQDYLYNLITTYVYG